MVYVERFEDSKTTEIKKILNISENKNTNLPIYKIFSTKDMLDMLDKSVIIRFYQDVRENIKQIDTIWYSRNENIIKIYIFIKKDIISVRKKIIEENLKLWNDLNNFVFEFGVHPKKYIRSFKLEKMDQLF